MPTADIQAGSYWNETRIPLVAGTALRVERRLREHYSWHRLQAVDDAGPVSASPVPRGMKSTATKASAVYAAISRKSGR